MRAIAVRWDQRDVVVATTLALAILAVVLIIVALAGTASDSENFLRDETLGGVPVALWMVALQQLIFIFAAWRFSVGKYRLHPRSLGLRWPKGRRPFLLAFAGWGVALLGIAVWQGLISAAGIDSLTPEDNVDEIVDFGGSLVTTILVVGLWGPFAEELFFRGFALAGLRRRFGDRGALVITSALFAVFHIEPTIYVPIFFFGIVLGWLYLKTDSIWPPIAAHAVHNSVILAVTMAAD
jgi:membrane protease YdiL (CAAX protease family)